ncbi:MAG TPA: twin-arginine translocase TatA/TatE family subunit [Terriglobia bacterium]|nr:twin-arginine translocase TatA/TatE family subunit [Terriglobia bacterium]
MEGLLQPTHLFFILLIVLIIFGPGKLPDLGRGLGKGIREFKDAIKGGMDKSVAKAEEEKKA